MNHSIVLWLLLAISTISIFSGVARASSSSAQSLGVDQRSLLLELRNSLVFDTSVSSKLVQWGQSADSWSGVTCEEGVVVGLDLSEESISGGIDGSSSLFRLEFLRSLNLAFNDFSSSTIPSGLGNLSRLVYLNLSCAGFSGKIPAELSRLMKLRTLDLSAPYNSDEPGLLKLENPYLRSLIGDLGELRELYLDMVNVSAEGSEWCVALSSSVPKLEVLSMSYCSLSGPIDASLMSLANLTIIRLDGNNLSTAVPTFLENFSSLKSLSLMGCGMQGQLPQEVFQVQTLQTLDLSFNPLLHVPLPDFPEDSSLETLVLSATNISGRLPDSISNLRKLSRLDMSTCGLRGSIPSSMGNLSELTHLDLSFNNISGSVPPNCASRKLAYLDLSFNNLSGSVPPYGASRNLTEIYLSNNALTGQITSVGWENLLYLEYLDLQYNSLAGEIPPALFTLPRLERLLLSGNRFNGQLIIYPNVSSYQLEKLDLGSNMLQGTVPSSIFDLRGLWYLSLSYNNFSGSMNINALQGLGNLTVLDLSYSGLSINTMASASAAASSFPDLNALHLASCQLRTLPQFLANQSNLISLDLSHNYIQGEVPKWIWTLEYLAFLNLSSNFFEAFQRTLHNHTHVVDLHSNMRPNKYLDFSKNKFHGSIPKSICEAGYLEVLDLSHNHLNGNIPDCLMMRSLVVLNLRNNQLSGDIPQNISETCSLKTLDVSENLLQGHIPLWLANCTTLEIVNIGNNQIEGTFPCHFKAISSLRVLVLRFNKLHGKIRCPHSHIAWKMLQIIDVSSNDFSGTLPASLFASCVTMKAIGDFDRLQYRFSSPIMKVLYYEDTMSVTLKGLELELVRILTIFTSIDFSGNRLEGPIPHTLGDLIALYFLNLSHNAISGSIPPVFGNLHQLESMDLSWNYLDGTIPAQLANLDFLSFLNLSYNQLVGSIPASGHFLTFSESSFGGNLALCGLQLNKSCSITTNGTEEAGDNGDGDDNDFKWFYMGMPLGFAVGFCVFCGPLVFIQSWRVAYYRFWDKVLFRHSRPRKFPWRFSC